ncbi:unnamed protein product, partial [Ascophyllum nodosum]
LYSFLFHFFIASSFPNPLPPSVWVVYPAGGGEQGWRCGVCVACIQSASATCITLLGDTCRCLRGRIRKCGFNSQATEPSAKGAMI